MTELKVTAEPGSHEVSTEREIDAPRYLVFRAYKEPELLAQWLGPRRYGMEIDTYEFRDGGRWRYVHSDEQGNSFAFHGVFHGDPSPDGMVQTFEFPRHGRARGPRRQDDGPHGHRLPVGRGPRRHGAERDGRRHA